MKRRTRTRAGFTLIEIILVLGIIVLMATVTAAVLYGPAKGARRDLEKTHIATVSHALELYNANIGHYPTEDEGGLRALVTKPNFADATMGENWHGPYANMDQLKDVWGTELHYQLVQAGETSDVPFKLWSSGPDMTDGSEDDIRNWTEGTL